MIRSIGNLLSVCILLAISSGCKKENYYTPQYLKPLSAKTAEYKNTIDGITLLFKKLPYKDSAYLFGDLIGCFYPNGTTQTQNNQGIYPVHISIHNTSNYTLMFDASGISLPLMTKHELLDILCQKAPAIDHEAINFDITRKIIPYTSTLQQDEALSSLIFVKATDWEPDFTVKLERADNAQEVVFHVHTKDTL